MNIAAPWFQIQLSPVSGVQLSQDNFTVMLSRCSLSALSLYLQRILCVHTECWWMWIFNVSLCRCADKQRQRRRKSYECTAVVVSGRIYMYECAQFQCVDTMTMATTTTTTYVRNRTFQCMRVAPPLRWKIFRFSYWWKFIDQKMCVDFFPRRCVCVCVELFMHCTRIRTYTRCIIAVHRHSAQLPKLMMISIIIETRFTNTKTLLTK